MGHIKSERDVVLPAQGRRAKIRGRAAVVEVSLGFATPGGFDNAVYRHPEVRFGTIAADGTVSHAGPRVTMRFQTHATGLGDAMRDRRGPGGFLRMGSGQWSGGYGAEIRADFGSELASAELARVLALVTRARAAGPTWGTKGCELLQLLVGLRRIGVEVRIQRQPPAHRLESVAA